MRNIFSFLAFLAIIGFGGCLPVTVTGENHSNKTEWVIRQIEPRRKKVISLSDCLSLLFLNINSHYWFKEYVRLFDHKIHVKILSQARSAGKHIIYNQYITRINSPRLSIDGYDSFCVRPKNTGSIKSNHLPANRWIYKKRSIN